MHFTGAVLTNSHIDSKPISRYFYSCVTTSIAFLCYKQYKIPNLLALTLDYGLVEMTKKTIPLLEFLPIKEFINEHSEVDNANHLSGEFCLRKNYNCKIIY